MNGMFLIRIPRIRLKWWSCYCDKHIALTGLNTVGNTRFYKHIALIGLNTVDSTFSYKHIALTAKHG